MTTEPKHTPLLPVVVFAGTILQDAKGNTLLCACEETELRGGTHDSIRETLKLAAKSINEAPSLLADNERLREALRMALVQIVQDNDERKVESGLRGTEWQIRGALSATERKE